MRRTRVLVGIVGFATITLTAVIGWRFATQQRNAPPEDVRERSEPPGNVHEVITAYLADRRAAMDKYSDAIVTASGVVRWSAWTDEVTTRGPGERLPQVDEFSKQATVLIIVDGRHTILADFGEENYREALALREGERVTIRGRHDGTGGVTHNGVILVLNGCEFVR